MYGEGISKNGELIDLGSPPAWSRSLRAWFSYGSQRIGQGRENAKTSSRKPGIAAEIEKAIRQNAGIVAGHMMDGSTPAAEDSAGE